MVGDDVTKECLKVLNDGCSIGDVNSTNIVLVIKRKNLTKMVDFRPISLCKVIYNIVTKTLVNKLKLVLPNLIYVNQSAFVPGRLIIDNVIIAFKMVHSLQK